MPSSRWEDEGEDDDGDEERMKERERINKDEEGEKRMLLKGGSRDEIMLERGPKSIWN